MKKLVMAIVQDQDAGRVVDSLVAQNFRATRINTAGGFLKRGNATILVGVDEELVGQVVETIDNGCEARRASGDAVTVGAGTVFVLPINSLLHL